VICCGSYHYRWFSFQQSGQFVKNTTKEETKDGNENQLEHQRRQRQQQKKQQKLLNDLENGVKMRRNSSDSAFSSASNQTPVLCH
jgi:hypothetical protein